MSDRPMSTETERDEPHLLMKLEEAAEFWEGEARSAQSREEARTFNETNCLLRAAMARIRRLRTDTAPDRGRAVFGEAISLAIGAMRGVAGKIADRHGARLRAHADALEGALLTAPEPEGGRGPTVAGRVFAALCRSWTFGGDAVVPSADADPEDLDIVRRYLRRYMIADPEPDGGREAPLEKNAPWTLGWLTRSAGYRGTIQSLCPFDRGDNRRRQWIKGYTDADQTAISEGEDAIRGGRAPDPPAWPAADPQPTDRSGGVREAALRALKYTMRSGALPDAGRADAAATLNQEIRRLRGEGPERPEGEELVAPATATAAAPDPDDEEEGGEREAWSARARKLLADLLHDLHDHEWTNLTDCPCSAVYSRMDDIADLLTAPEPEGGRGPTVAGRVFAALCRSWTFGGDAVVPSADADPEDLDIVRRYLRRYMIADPEPDGGRTSGVAEIRAERHHQTEKWGRAHDREYHGGKDLAVAAAVMALAYRYDGDLKRVREHVDPLDIPHAGDWINVMAEDHIEDHRRMLAIAGAFCAAELDRIDPQPLDRSGAEHKAGVFTMPAPKSVQGRDYQARCSCGWRSGRFVTKSVVERKRQRHLENATPDPDDGDEGGERIVLPPLADGFQWVVTEDAIYSEETEPLRYPDHGPERTLFCHLRSTTEPEAEDG